MKKERHLFSLPGAVSVAIVLSTTALGATEQVDGVRWGYDVNGGAATVTNATPASGELVIPSSLGGYPVTGIGKNAFSECNDLTGVSISEGVTHIGFGAFAGCNGLMAVTIPDGVTDIPPHAFYSCRELKTADIGNGVTNIGIAAFAWCDGLSSLTMGNQVETIGISAFAGCASLKEVTIPNSVATIRDAAFLGCSGLGAVTIPNGVTDIGAMAFHWCRALERVTIGNRVESIGEYAFSGCKALTEVTMGKNLARIGNWTFAGCDSLTTLNLPPEWGGSERLVDMWLPPECQTVFYEGMQLVLFLANGGICSQEQGAYAMGSTYGPLPAATREGHAFAGWFTTADGGIPVTEDSIVSKDGTRTLYAHWKALQAVIFDANGGTCATETGTYVVGESYGELPTTATKEHYAFEGWFTAAEGGAQVTEDSRVTATATRTLYAHWRLAEQVVTFSANGGECDTESSVFSIGQTYFPLPIATWDNHAFAGWFTAANGGTRVTEYTSVTEEASLTLHAQWKTQQTVTFDANGGLCDTETARYTVGECYGALPSLVIREHYAFAGWFTAEDGGTQVTEESSVTDETSRILYAHWMLGEQIVTFEANGGLCNTETDIYDIGETYGALPTATREGYVFAGWFSTTEGGTPVTEESLVTADALRTLYAHWKVRQAVTFDANGGECATTSAKYTEGDCYGSLPTEATLVHYAFAGWFTLVEGGTQVTTESIVTADAARTLFAHWRLVEQVVTFDANGGTCTAEPTAYVIGKNYGNLPTTATREHFAFAGWFTEADGGEQVTVDDTVTAEADRTLYAHWTPVDQVVTFVANGGVASSEFGVYPIGTVYGGFPTATRTNHVFEGWFTASTGGVQVTEESVVPGDAERTLYARWALVEQSVTFECGGGRCEPSMATYSVGTVYGDLPTPIWEECMFAGWFTESIAGEQVTVESVVTVEETRVLYAQVPAVSGGKMGGEGAPGLDEMRFLHFRFVGM